MRAYLDAFYSIEGEYLSKVVSQHYENTPEALWLLFEKRSLLIQVNPDDDTIRVTAGDVMEAAGAEYVDLSSTAFWRDFTGQQFGWGWIVTNQQGNCDGAMLSFGGISPQVLL